MTRHELDMLRDEIHRIDTELVELLAKRRSIAREIGLTKKKDGLPLRDVERERKVIHAITRGARALDVDERLAGQIARLLIADAVRVQRAAHPMPVKGKETLVIGGAGRMGEWMCRFLSNRGASVKVWDPRGRLSGHVNVHTLDPYARIADIVVVASPLGVCPEELQAAIECRPTGVVFDLCSIKTHIAGILRRAAADGIKVTSVHPMFGPRVANPQGLNVLVCDVGSKAATQFARRLFAGAGARVTELYLEEHDRLMAYVLGLPHSCGLLFGGTLARSDTASEVFRKIQGTSFSKLAALSKEISLESKRIYHDIQSLNPNTKQMMESMEVTLKEIRSAAADTDPVRFANIMESIKAYLED